MASAGNNGLSPTTLGSSNSIQFNVTGGIFVVAVILSTGSVDFKMIGPDGGTLISVLNTPFTTNGTVSLYLPAGQFQFILSSATGVSVCCAPVDLTQ